MELQLLESDQCQCVVEWVMVVDDKSVEGLDVGWLGRFEAACFVLLLAVVAELL